MSVFSIEHVWCTGAVVYLDASTVADLHILDKLAPGNDNTRAFVPAD